MYSIGARNIFVQRAPSFVQKLEIHKINTDRLTGKQNKFNMADRRNNCDTILMCIKSRLGILIYIKQYTCNMHITIHRVQLESNMKYELLVLQQYIFYSLDRVWWL